MMMVATPSIVHHSSNPMEGNYDDSDDPIAGYTVSGPSTVATRLKMYKARALRDAQRIIDDGDDDLEIVSDQNDEDEEDDPILLVGEGMDTTGDELYAAPEVTQEDGECEEGEGDTTIRPGAQLVDEDVELDELVDEDEDDARSDGSASTDEETTLMLREPAEQTEIKREFSELLAAVPRIAHEYALVDRLGTGTFSSVYKARDLRQDAYDNSLWLRPSSRSEFVALKRIYVTSSPERISNEIFILAEVAGCRHVSQLITAFRERDQVIAVIPYQRNVDFRVFFHTLPIDGVQAYFRCLFRALRDIHARGIVHRDVKPANFLFDPRTYEGVLVDFGLAMHVSSQSGHGCIHSAPSADRPHGIFLEMDENVRYTLHEARREARKRKGLPPEKVGYPAEDHRPVSKANRAGTRGFRAPEVLLKCDNQSGAIDVWAAATILLFFLTGRFPLYTAGDDVEALIELTTILGYKRMERVALLHNRTFITNVPSVGDEGMTWRDFVLRLNPALEQAAEHSTMGEAFEDALDFAERCLDPEAPRRMTARDALYHPFLQQATMVDGSGEVEEEGVEVELEDDDAQCAHPPGGGVCAALHHRDDVTGDWCAVVPSTDDDAPDRVVQLAVGEGLCIGRAPCAFHAHLDWTSADS